MKCDTVKEYIDDYLDGYLEDADYMEVGGHLKECPNCQGILSKEQALRKALRELSVPPPPRGFSERVFQETVATCKRQSRRRSWFRAGGAVAAGLALWFIVGMPGQFPHGQPQQALPVSTMNLHAPKTVKMIVLASRDMKNATVTVELPEHLEIEGFPGRRSISWDTDLYKGKNLLALPIIAKTIGKEQIITRIVHESKSKLLKMEMLVDGSPMKSNAGEKQYG